MVRLLVLAALAACNDKPALTIGPHKVHGGDLRTIEGADPEYAGRYKRYRAFRLAPALDGALPGWRERDLEFVASDGYVVRLPGMRVVEGDAHVAVEDLDHPGFEPVGPKHSNPGPFYLVWPSASDHVRYPRPYQLTTVRFAPAQPQLDPGADASAQRGLALFKERCLRCHAINREGGRVGPELNVPKNVTEYLPEPLIRQLIRTPQRVRYGNMPPHGDLDDVALDDILAYLRAMRERKQDSHE